MSLTAKILGVCFAIWLLNIACAHWLSFPFAYCWIWSALYRHLVLPIGSFAILFCALWFLGAMVMGKHRHAIAAVVVMGLVGGSDGFAKALLTLPGNSCA